ncbi:MAG: selenide, water dikinase SelD [Dehalococcoidales bacterium]|nr:selenide, water dikinase SelD [Dehalococcoidales bacterium]
MEGLPVMTDPNLIIGMERSEDAGVYKLSDELAIVQTVDFFTPIVDDPYQFGQIAVANSLSDVYAKGGKPLTAMNIVCFPVKTMDISVLRDILKGGLDKMLEAGVILVGGHSVEDNELKYGLSVTGTIHPSKVIRNTGCRPGDKLILTKPLGVGIINTALKGEMAERSAVDKAVRCMSTLNKKASELMQISGVNACTDVTGFGLIGHACEMIEDTGVGIIINANDVPYFPEARELAEMGLVPGGTHRNREYRKAMVKISEDLPVYINDILFDPQTSGGLLISLPSGNASALLSALHNGGVDDAAIIGEIVDEPRGKIIVR